MSIEIEVIKDDTCKGLKIPNTIKFNKEDIFNYGVFHYEIPPEKISDSDFEYLESKIPAYIAMYEDHVHVSDNSIECKVEGEAAKNVSELVGISTGLKTAIEIFNLEKKEIEKIPTSKEKEKRLDYKSVYNGDEIQIETKGTTYKSSVNTMIKDIHAKKVGKNSINHKYGFVTLFDKLNEKKGSKIFVTDPFVEDTGRKFNGIYKYINYYLTYFSFILDNPEYNKIYKILQLERNVHRKTIKIEKLKYHFSFDNKKYIGQCFDKRLILKLIQDTVIEDDTINTLFRKLTSNVNKNKYFLGIDEKILKSINSKNIKFLYEYKTKDIYYSEKAYSYIQMSDGILLIISKDASLKEMEEKFTEEEVKKRLSLLREFEKGRPHKCGASCRSREIRGKSCEILTYREHCHFHR